MIALLKLIAVFAVIVLLLGRRWNLGLVLLLAAAVAGLLFSYPLRDIGRDVLLAFVDPLTLHLALVVVLIMALGELLRRTAATRDLVEALQALVPNGRIVIAALPMLVGLLPMVGGAMFSAPMVDAVGKRLGVGGARKTFVNYWLRHVWEPIFPLYPSMLLAATLLDLTPVRLAGATWPLAVAALAGGLLFGLAGVSRRAAAEGEPPSTARAQYARALVKGVWPVVFVVAFSLLFPTLMGLLSLAIDERIGLILGLVLAILLVLRVKHVQLIDLGLILRRRIPWGSVVVVLGALAFRRVLEGSGAVLAVSSALGELRIPPAVVAFAAPFIPGLLTGLVVAAFSIGFPIVLPLVAGSGGLGREWISWLVAAGFVGTMCSPVHLCLALTRVYFKAGWGAVYRLLAPAALLIVMVAGLLLIV